MLSLRAKQCRERGSGGKHLSCSCRWTFFPVLHKAHVALTPWVSCSG